MATLVIIAWNLEATEAAHFGDLFDRVQPDEVKIIYGLGSEDDAKLVNGIGGASVSFHRHRPVTEDPLFKQGKIDGDAHWGRYISSLANELRLDVRSHVQNGDLHVFVGAGSTYLSGCLEALGEALGAMIWTLVGSADERRAVDTSMKSPIEEGGEGGLPVRRPLSEMEAGVLSRLAEESLSGCEWVEGVAICSGGGRVPRPRGLSTITDQLEENGLLKKRQGGSIEYSLTDLGFLHAICELSRGERLEPMDGSEEAVIMFHGGNEDAESESKIFRNYLDEHGLNGLFDKYALITVEWGDDEDKLESMSKMLNDVIESEDLIGSSSISNLLSSDTGSFHSTASRLLTEVRSIASGNGENWSLIIEKVPAQLRGVLLRYCRSSGISVVSVFRRRGHKGAKGQTSNTFLGKKKHRFRLPSEDEISSIRGGMEISPDSFGKKAGNARNVLATILFEKDSGGNGKMLQRDIKNFNNTALGSSGLRLEDKQNVTRGISVAEEYGLIHRGGGSKHECSLTPSGEILARMTLLQHEGE